MTYGLAYRTSKPEVLTAWEQWQEHCRDVRERRDALSDAYGRNLMIRASAMQAGGNEVTGFEAWDSDLERDTLHRKMQGSPELVGGSGELKLRHKYRPLMLVPNTRRKAGKDLEQQFHALRQNGPDLPGMPGFVFMGLAIVSPGLFRHKRTIWAYWGDQPKGDLPSDSVDMGVWMQDYLSNYHKAREAYEREHADG